jgi:hypothetical protein
VGVDIRNVRASDVKIDKATDEVTISSGILKRDPSVARR